MPKTKEEVDKKISDIIAEFSGLIDEEGARVIIEKELGRDYFHPFYPSISTEFFSKIKREKNMSQLPKITIADLLTGTRVGMLEARISEVSVYTQLSKYATPANSTVNVYRLKLIDTTGEINYSDWCKKPNVQRAYKVNQIIRFHHAKLKPSTNIDPNTGQLYPPNVTVEKASIIELLNSNGDAIIPENLTPAVVQPVSAAVLPPVASSPVASIPQGIPVAQSTPATEWLNVKAQYPSFYNAVDELFGEIWKALADQPNITQKLENDFKGYMDMIWGA